MGVEDVSVAHEGRAVTRGRSCWEMKRCLLVGKRRFLTKPENVVPLATSAFARRRGGVATGRDAGTFECFMTSR